MILLAIIIKHNYEFYIYFSFYFNPKLYQAQAFQFPQYY
jgi:hypothetical protein